MADYRSIVQSRRNRKLPNIRKQGSSKSSFFWLSFQSGLQWIRKNEKTISKFSQLIQFYPNLIQDSSLDEFWEFLEPLLEQQNEAQCPVETIRSRPSFNYLNPVPSKASSERGLPSISVTTTSDTSVPMPFIPSKNARTPRVHLINRHDTLNLKTVESNYSENGISNQRYYPSHQNLMELLQEHFYIRSAYPPARHNEQNSTNNDITHLNVLSESDVCVFLFTDATMDDDGCFHDLCTALALNIPVLFVRHYNQELPNTFAESIQRLSRGCVSLNDYVEKYVFGNHESKRCVYEKSKETRPNKAAALTAIRTRSSSTSDINVKGAKLRRDRNKPSASVSDTDLLLYLINSFQSAHILDESNIPECSRQLRLRIYRAIGISDADGRAGCSTAEERHSPSLTTGHDNAAIKSKFEFQSALEKNDCHGNRSNHLNVPEADNMLSAREWSNSGCISAPPRDDPGQKEHFTYHFRSITPASLEQASTTYLIFDDQNASKKVRKISFPLDENDVVENCCDMDSDEFDPGGSPIHFPDIDLARVINATIDNPDVE